MGKKSNSQKRKRSSSQHNATTTTTTIQNIKEDAVVVHDKEKIMIYHERNNNNNNNNKIYNKNNIDDDDEVNYNDYDQLQKNNHHQKDRKKQKHSHDDYHKFYKDLGLSVTLDVGDDVNDNDDDGYTSSNRNSLIIPKPYDASNFFPIGTTKAIITNKKSSTKWIYELVNYSFYKILVSKRQQKKYNRANTNTQKINQTSWSPTPIQLQSWSILTTPVNDDDDDDDRNKNKRPLNVIGISPTGSGKSLSFIIPLVLLGMTSNHQSRILYSKEKHDERKLSSCKNNNYHTNIIGLIVTPTRELAIQVSKVVTLVCKSANKLLFSMKDEKDEKKTLSYNNNNISIRIDSIVIYGGVEKMEQIKAFIGMTKSAKDTLSEIESTLRNVIVTATPGRLIDLMGLESKNNNNTASNDDDDDDDDDDESRSQICSLFQSTQMLIIDEADRMATQSDISNQVDLLLNFFNNRRNNEHHHYLTIGLFSATLPQRVMGKFNEWATTPRCTIKVNSVTVGSTRKPSNDDDGSSIEDKNDKSLLTTRTFDDTNEKVKDTERSPLNLSAIPSHVEQILHVCANHKKPKKLIMTLAKIYSKEKKDKEMTRSRSLTIVFFKTIKTLQYIYQLLQKEKIQSVQFHSQMKQDKREFQLNLFRSGKNPIMLATDIAARGIHVKNVSYIINYDFPATLEQYVHRCGRAGRNQVTDEIINSDETKDDCGKTKNKATVYSFFHRELAPMAKDVVDLLRSCNAFVDPNLLLLIPDGNCRKEESSRSKRRRRNKKNQTIEEEVHHNSDSDNNEFPLLQLNRIVLKRAGHVSDASISDSDDH